MIIDSALSWASKKLMISESPAVDSQYLLCHVLSVELSYLHTWPERPLTAQQQQLFEQLVLQRQQGQPIAHLTGRRGFWSLDLQITADTLIPRPDTELLVSLAVAKVEANMVVVDLGTGSGAIALSLAAEVPRAKLLAMDYSLPAVKVAKNNAQRHDLTNVSFWQGSWMTALKDNSVDMVVSNPPYIEQDDPHLSQGDLRFEPRSALASGIDGLDDIRQIIKQAKRCLKASCYCFIEHGYQQAEQVKQLFIEAGFINVSCEQDFGGNDRVVQGQQPL